MIILCHKCAGVLTGNAPQPAYGCGCISGYVRDWQTPTPAADVREAQIAELKSNLALYKQQGRKPNDHHVVWTHDWLRKLEQRV